MADDRLELFIVADGMGGHAAGEVASKVAVESIETFIRGSQDPDETLWSCGMDPALSAIGNRVRTAIYFANKQVFRASEQNGDYAGMGTTVVCALIHEDHLAIGHVGDSRLYVLSQGVLRVQTQDDTWAATLLARSGDQGVEALKAHPMRHVLTNVLGAPTDADVHVSERELVDGEMLLLCTDGIHNVVDDSTLTTLMSSTSDLRTIADSIMATAIERGSRDNVTVLLVHYMADQTRDA